MLVTVVGAGTGRPVEGAVVTVAAYDADKPIPKPPPNSCAILPKHPFTADERGRVVVPLGQYRLKYVAMTVKHPGYAARELIWSGADGDPRIFPAERVVKLEAGKTIGGVVRDEAGRAVAHATVDVQHYMTAEDQNPIRETDLLRGSATTDEEGKWTIQDAPPVRRNVLVEVSHPDFLEGRMEEGEIDKLGALSAGVTLRAGVGVSGVVVDKENRPIAGASVCYNIHTSQVPSVRTDKQGRFHVDRVAKGELTLIAQAKGYAPMALDAEPGKGGKVQIVLGEAHVFQGRVVDAAGNPVSGVSLDVRRWGKHNLMRLIRTTTDVNGRFEFDGPEEPVAIEAYHREYMSIWMKVLSPEKAEHQLVMLSPLKITGTAVDAETGEAIKSFRVVPGYGDYGRVGWDTYNIKPAYDGRYELVLSNPREIYKARIEAEGYLPAVSQDIRYGVAEDGKAVTFDARLHKGAGPAGMVVGADRRAISDAEVVLMTPDTQTMLTNMRLSRIQNYSKVVKTDPEGRFAFTPTEQNYTILVLHDGGYAEVSKEDLAKSSTVTLRPWGRIEGRVFIGRQPGAHQTAMIMSGMRHRSDGKPDVSKDWKAETDETGHFVMDRVPAGEYQIGRMLPVGRDSYTVTHARTVTVAAGQAASVTIGGKGRPVVGKVRVPAEVAEKYQLDFMSLAEPLPKFPDPYPANWDSMTKEQKGQWVVDWNKSDEARARHAKWEHVLHSRRYYPFAMDDKELTFRIEDVEPGVYEFGGHVNHIGGPGSPNFGKSIAEFSVPVTIPEGTEVFDAGVLEPKKREPATTGKTRGG